MCDRALHASLRNCSADTYSSPTAREVSSSRFQHFLIARVALLILFAAAGKFGIACAPCNCPFEEGSQPAQPKLNL
eukprot:6206858-Pleurochrysis_carterae.AAC.6